jgi:hypothetical protein
MTQKCVGTRSLGCSYLVLESNIRSHEYRKFTRSCVRLAVIHQPHCTGSSIVPGYGHPGFELPLNHRCVSFDGDRTDAMIALPSFLPSFFSINFSYSSYTLLEGLRLKKTVNQQCVEATAFSWACEMAVGSPGVRTGLQVCISFDRCTYLHPLGLTVYRGLHMRLTWSVYT